MNDRAYHRELARNKLVRARGQIDGIIKMIDEDRYCIDISTQLLAAMGMMKSANLEILKGHMKSCMVEAVSSSKESADASIEEMIDTLDKYMR